MLNSRGFSLIEMAVVLVVLALLAGGLLVPLSAHIEQRKGGGTDKKLAEITDALLGFAMSQDRLPCPASSTSSGVESFCTNSTGSCGIPTTTVQPHGRCSNPYDGFVPAVTLGVYPTNNVGYAMDEWGYAIHYAVTESSAYAFTKPSGMKTIGMSSLTPDLHVCSSSPNPATPLQAASDCGTAVKLTDKAVAVVYSTGGNSGLGGTSREERANANPAVNSVPIPNSYTDKIFVSHVKSEVAATEFDDLLTWLSPHILFNRLVSAGRLP